MANTHPSYTIDTTFATKNIASAASVYAFTAAASAKVQFLIKLNDAAGSGDYVAYLTHQWLGAGTAAVMLPKTTCAAAAGETVIEFATMELNVKATDVVNVMVDGLAGDTSVNGNIRIVADNPSVFDPAADTVANVTNLATYTGNVKQTGDAYARLTGTVEPLVAAQAIRDAMKLAPGAGAAAAGSVDTHLDDIVAGSTGAGAIAKTLTIDDGTDPLDGVSVWATTDSAGTNVVANDTTDAFGHVTFYLDAGTYYIWCALAGHNFSNPATEVWV